MIFLFDAGAAGAISSVFLLELIKAFGAGAVELLFENRIGLNSLELGLEITDGFAMSGTVRATAAFGHVISIIVSFIAGMAPITFSSTLLLHLLGIFTNIAGLGKVAREMFFDGGGTGSEASVVTIIGLVRASHNWCNK